MKPLILFSAALFTFSFCNRPKSSKEKPGIVYVKPPKNGNSVTKYPSGEICSIIPYHNGERNGKATTYHRNGEVNFVINYKDGKKEGLATWFYSTGSMYQTREYKNDQMHGWRNDYTPSGKHIMEIPYENDRVMPGGREFTLKGELRPHPEIITETQNTIFANGAFTYLFKLSEAVSRVDFYLDYTNENTPRYWTFEQLQKVDRKKGQYIIHLMPGQLITQKIHVFAHFKRSNGYEGIIKKTVNVALSY